MSTLDIVLGILLLLGLFQGFRKGFFVEAASLIGLLAGIYGAIHFSYFAADYLVERTDWSEQTINLAAFAITFILIVVVVSLAGKLLTKMANFAALGLINKLLGAGFGLLKTAFILSVIIMFLGAAGERLQLIDQEDKENSILYRPVASIAPAFLPAILKTARDTDLYDVAPTEEQQI
ncbi:CvpA family protein [Croceiramulus getboli]|nr:CvpA family protein [Flavobacteriaceae bacterium YJPT1-3]